MGNKEQQTLRIWKHTLKKLRMIYALTGDSMVSILDRIVSEELERVRRLEESENQEDV